VAIHLLLGPQLRDSVVKRVIVVFYKRKIREEKMIKSHIETQNKICVQNTNSIMVEKSFLTISEAFQLLRVSRTTLWRLISVS